MTRGGEKNLLNAPLPLILYLGASSNLSPTTACTRITWMLFKNEDSLTKPTYIKTLWHWGSSFRDNSEVRSSLRITAFLSEMQMDGKLRIVSGCLNFTKTSSLCITLFILITQLYSHPSSLLKTVILKYINT